VKVGSTQLQSVTAYIESK